MRTHLVLAGLLAALAGCGGGGGGSAPAASSAASSTSPSTSGNTVAAADNVQPIIVDPGLRNSINIPFVSVTVCATNSNACQIIDHVVVDTASTGLRIVSSALSPALSLTPQTDATNNAVVECAQFAGGVTWGPVKVADVKIAGELAPSVPIQVIDDAAFAISTDCANKGPALSSVDALLGNGILGVGFFRQDCGSRCAQTATTGTYYGCSTTTGTCQPITLPLSRQVQNPVALFANDNNGVIVQLPAIPATGAATVTGSLIFGIGTRSNNALGNATVFPVSASTGRFTTVYKGGRPIDGFVDTGSNALFFPDSTIPRCSNNIAFYCPGATLNLSGTIQGTNGTTATVNFSVGNTNTLLQNNPAASAFNNIGGPSLSSFDWGLPFYYGRTVYHAVVDASTPGGTGPYIAF